MDKTKKQAAAHKKESIMEQHKPVVDYEALAKEAESVTPLASPSAKPYPQPLAVITTKTGYSATFAVEDVLDFVRNHPSATSFPIVTETGRKIPVVIDSIVER